jgi:hypothetical protein
VGYIFNFLRPPWILANPPLEKKWPFCITVHCEIEVVVTFDFSFALKQMQTHAFKRILVVSI